jgi:hypothetical protein
MEESQVDIYVIKSPRNMGEVSGLFGTKKMEIASYKEMEELCLSDYYESERKYPDWNFQEKGEPYPIELEEIYQQYHEKRIERNKK